MAAKKKGFCIVRASYIIAEGSKNGEEDQVLDTVKGAVQDMHQVVQDPRKMREGKGLEMFLSGKAIHQINLETYIPRCVVCDSVMHWVKDCPYKDEAHVQLFTKDIKDEYINQFVGEKLTH